MTREEYIKEQCEALRSRLHETVDRQINNLFRKLNNEPLSTEEEKQTFSLSFPPAIFKGQKTCGITLPDGTFHPSSTWRDAVLTILKDCNQDPGRHEMMMDLRGKVNGRFRSILTDTPEELDVALKIDEGLFFEGDFDTEYLLRILRDRILDSVGYDYSAVSIYLRPTVPIERIYAELAPDLSGDTDEEPESGLTMSM